MHVRSRQHSSPRSLISPAPIMMRAISHRSNHRVIVGTPSRGVAVHDMGHANAIRKAVSHSWLSQPKPYQSWPTLMRDRYNAQTTSIAGAEQAPVRKIAVEMASPSKDMAAAASSTRSRGANQCRDGTLLKARSGRHRTGATSSAIPFTTTGGTPASMARSRTRQRTLKRSPAGSCDRLVATRSRKAFTGVSPLSLSSPCHWL
mmetsp:Transcript_52539/g.161711  ORF Transcript_52539/g.161711 Transcript_52539/m.161711 type:complete len:203 (-) Transcript_52539:106-714(-)